MQYALQCKLEGRFETAIDYMDKAFKLRPDSNLLFNRAKVLNHLKEYAKALDTVNRAIEMDTNHKYFLYKAQILSSLYRFNDSLLSIETAIAIYNCAYYQIAKAQMLIISGRTLDGIDHLIWIKDNYDNLANTDDFRFLVSALPLCKVYQIKIPQIEPQLIRQIMMAEDSKKPELIRLLINIDAFSDIAESLDPEWISEIISGNLISNQEKVTLLGSLGSVENWRQVKQLLKLHASSLDNQFYAYYNACADLYLDDSCTVDTLNNMARWPQEYKDNFILKLWSKKHYSSLREYFQIEKPSNTSKKWMQFWIAVITESLPEDNEILEGIPQGLEEIIQSQRESNSLEVEAFGRDTDLNNLNVNLKAISELFPFDLPYDMLSWEMFIKVIKKIFPVQYANIIDHQAELIMKQSVNDIILIDNETYREYYIETSMKVELINSLSMIFISVSSSHFAASLSIVIGASRKMGDKMHNIVETSREEERNKVLSDLSHNIKNLLRSVIDPLESIKRDIPDQAPVIEDAIKGANLIREMVNSINFSYTVSIDDLIYDINNPGKESSSLYLMIAQSLRNAIGNMYDSQYYPQFMSNYFNTRQVYFDSKHKWDSVIHDSDSSNMIRFSKEYLFDLTLEIDPGLNMIVGNEKSSAIKLTILLQEIILNAVKYVSFVSREHRNLQIRLYKESDFIIMEVSNSYKPEVRTKTTGLGNIIINNFAKVLDCDLTIDKSADQYAVTLKLKNYWSNNG